MIQKAMRTLLMPGLILLLSACEELPDNDYMSAESLTLIALLEPGDSGMQEVRLTHPLAVGSEVNYASTWQPGAWITIWNQRSDTLLLEEDAANYRYTFDRQFFPLLPGDSVCIRVEGEWSGLPYSGQAWTRIVSQDGFSFVDPPSGGNEGYPADSLMFFDEGREENFNDVTAFVLDWTDMPADGMEYDYQIEFLAVSPDSSGGFTRTPGDRLLWLRDDGADALQPAPYPDIRLLPGPYSGPREISWFYFIFVDRDLYYGDTNMGYTQVSVRRMDHAAERFYATTHMWNREFETDPVEFNLAGDRVQGLVGSSTSIHLTFAIVDD